MVLMGNQYTSMQEVIQAKRANSPANSHVGFHDLTDQPKDGNPSFFVLRTKQSVYFRFEDTPAKTEDGKAKIASQNIAGVIPVACWQDLGHGAHLVSALATNRSQRTSASEALHLHGGNKDYPGRECGGT